MRSRTLLVVGGFVAIALYARGGCIDRRAPDEKLAAHFVDLCGIARDHRGKPVKGVKKLGHYLLENTGPMMHSFGSTIAVIERIKDDDQHDGRAYVARDRIRAPLRACEDDWARFADEVDADPEASALVERAMIRLQRTLEIVFGEQTAAVRFRDLPSVLRQAL